MLLSPELNAACLCLQGHEQSCAKCGKTETPTWRRAGKLIFCNACGLKHQRSVLAQNRRQRNA